ncbi:uncharacterized [Tachysurus ichikawai]
MPCAGLANYSKEAAAGILAAGISAFTLIRHLLEGPKDLQWSQCFYLWISAVCRRVSRELEVGWLLSVCLFISYALKPTSNKELALQRPRVIAIIVAGRHGAKGRRKVKFLRSPCEKLKIAILKTVVCFREDSEVENCDN